MRKQMPQNSFWIKTTRSDFQYKQDITYNPDARPLVRKHASLRLFFVLKVHTHSHRGPQPFRYCRPHYVYCYELRSPVSSRCFYFSWIALVRLPRRAYSLLPHVCLAVFLLSILIQYTKSFEKFTSAVTYILNRICTAA